MNILKIKNGFEISLNIFLNEKKFNFITQIFYKNVIL